MPAIFSRSYSKNSLVQLPIDPTPLGPISIFYILILLLATAVASPLAICQSQSSSQPAPAQPAPQQQQAQPPQPKDGASADAAKKTDKDKPKPKKVFTEEDLSSLHGGLSVVGDGSSGKANSSGAGSTASSGNGNAAGGRDEAYWRGSAKQLLDAIAATDQEIAKTNEEIKKYGADGFDAQSGFKNNVIYIDNRASKVQQLEKRKADLEKQLDELQEQGRKAGADPAWFR